MTLSEFRDELTMVLKNRTDAAADTTRLNRWVNQAYSHVSQPEVHRHKQLQVRLDITLVQNQNEYDLEALAGWEVLGVRDATYYMATAVTPTAIKRDLEPRSLQWFQRRTLASGQPTVYALDGDLLIVSGVPSAAEAGQQLRVHYWREPDAMALDTDDTLLATYWDRAVMLGAQWLAEWDLGYRELSLASKQEYVSYINEKSGAHELNAEDTGFEPGVESDAWMEVG
jgi:hypothetical protein